MLAAMDMQTVLVLEVRDIPQGPLENLEILYMLEAEEVVEFHAAILALEVQAEEVQAGHIMARATQVLPTLAEAEAEVAEPFMELPLLVAPEALALFSYD